ncbi:unnamed protein product [Microthlaspi erraticum]|uniref:Pentacotripeptide-repeat region of PRORP domain-containing protein n=1 Tax=Microthlaspi erraticum TaxID=1685480 RepID=A0A6D2KLV1_9BRAS|nr:unnamed protein product [Microthlaspi erraticum]
MTPILHQHMMRRILGCSNKSLFLFRSYGTSEVNQALQSRIKAALDNKSQITPVLDQWQQQGNQVKPSDIRGLIKNLRDSSRFSQALEASTWMGEEKVCNIYAKDYAARLHLIEKVLGLEEAEKFFKSIPANMRDSSVYSTLLTSYTRSKNTLDKAESTFKEMRELGFLFKPSPYNSMLSLYSQLGKWNMVEKLMKEMEDNKVKPDHLTVNNVLKACADASDLNALEMLMKTWVHEEEEDGIKLERGTIIAMAKAYVNIPDLLRTQGKELKVIKEVVSELVTKKGNELDIISLPSLLISRYCARGKEVKLRPLVNWLVTNNPLAKLRWMLNDDLVYGLVNFTFLFAWIMALGSVLFIILDHSVS